MVALPVGVLILLLAAAPSISQDEGSGCEYECGQNGICQSDGTCACSMGWKGDACDTPVCVANTTTVGSFYNCTDSDDLVHFDETDVGSVANGNLTCLCTNYTNQLPAVTRSCVLDNGVASWQTPVATMCSATNLTSISNDSQRAEFMVALTSSPDVTPTQVDEVITELGKYNVTDNPALAKTLLQIINNLIILGGGDSSAATPVTQRSDELITVVDNEVLLNSYKNDTEYSEMLSLVAVANFLGAGTTGVSFGTNRIDSMAWFETGDSSNTWNTSARVNAPALSRAAGDIGFKAYGTCILHGNNCDRSGIVATNETWFFNSIIIGAVFPSGSLVDLTFELFLTDADFAEVVCMRWNGADFINSSCSFATVEQGRAACRCTESGDFIVRTKYFVPPVTETPTSPPGGLSAGEIAGIAIGATAGAALIAGGGYYGYSKSKKKKKKKNKIQAVDTSDETLEMNQQDGEQF